MEMMLVTAMSRETIRRSYLSKAKDNYDYVLIDCMPLLGMVTLNAFNADTVASSLENVVYLELCRRGYTVNVGKSGSGEIDFVAVRQNEKLYVQVTQELRSPKTEKREYDRLLEIHDNYPKYVLTTDEFSGGNYEGVKTMHIADFLLSSEY